MNPRLVLSLWRERWGKAADSAVKRPYLEGKLNLWGSELTHAGVWALPGVSALVLLSCSVLLVWMLTIHFSLGGQFAFAALFISIALYVRRYAGTLVTLVLLGMSTLATTRYLYWRFTQTLSQDFNWDFVLGLGLSAAELYLWLLVMLGWLQTIWPVKRAPVHLPQEPKDWPTVDVFIPGQDCSHSAIQGATAAALALDWPRSKLKVYILEDKARAEIEELAASMGVGYLTHPDNVNGKPGNINHALPETKGALIALVDCNQPPDPSFLQTVAGWFMRDRKLGMLQPAHHFLAPAPASHALALFHAPTSGGSCAVLRRSMLLDIGGVVTESVTGSMHTALKLQAQGYGHAYIGVAGEADMNQGQRPLGARQPTQATTALVCVDDPFRGNTLRWKLKLASLHAMLQFYYAVPRWVFFTAPLAYLLAGFHIIQTSPERLASYALVHLLLAYFVQARLQGPTRFTLWADIRETVLACYLLVPTTLTLLRTEFGRCRDAMKVGKPRTEAAFDWMVALPYVTVFVLNLAGFGMGIARMLQANSREPEIVALYFLWTTCNLLLMAAMLAVAQETRHIRQQTHALLKMPAMVKLPSGHTVSCVTQNFPQATLTLEVPTPVAVEAGSAISLSIFLGHREFTFPARVVTQQNGVLRISIGDAAQSDYLLFGADVFAREANWPKWLPGRNANRLLPPRITQPIMASWDKLLAALETLGNYVKWTRFANWIKKWKPTT